MMRRPTPLLCALAGLLLVADSASAQFPITPITPIYPPIGGFRPRKPEPQVVQFLVQSNRQGNVIHDTLRIMTYDYTWNGTAWMKNTTAQVSQVTRTRPVGSPPPISGAVPPDNTPNPPRPVPPIIGEPPPPFTQEIFVRREMRDLISVDVYLVTTYAYRLIGGRWQPYVAQQSYVQRPARFDGIP
jgi:hypothetical protein